MTFCISVFSWKILSWVLKFYCRRHLFSMLWWLDVIISGYMDASDGPPTRGNSRHDGETQTSRRHPQSEHILRADVSALGPQVFLGHGPTLHLAPAGLEPLQNAAAGLAVPLRDPGAVRAARDAFSNRRVAAGFGSAHRRLLSVTLGLSSACDKCLKKKGKMAP